VKRLYKERGKEERKTKGYIGPYFILRQDKGAGKVGGDIDGGVHRQREIVPDRTSMVPKSEEGFILHGTQMGKRRQRKVLKLKQKPKIGRKRRERKSC